MHRFLLTLLSLLATVAVALNSTLVSQVSAEDKNVNRVQPYAKNPFYCQYKGEAVLLLGGSDDDNLFQWTGKKLTDQLDLLKSVGGNYVRNTMSDRDEGGEWGPAPDGFEVAHFSTELARWEDDFALSPEKRAKRPRRACSVERMIGWKVARMTIIASTGPTFGRCPVPWERSCTTSKPQVAHNRRRASEGVTTTSGHIQPGSSESLRLALSYQTRKPRCRGNPPHRSP